jgi:hypothetical protein
MSRTRSISANSRRIVRCASTIPSGAKRRVPQRLLRAPSDATRGLELLSCVHHEERLDLAARARVELAGASPRAPRRGDSGSTAMARLLREGRHERHVGGRPGHPASDGSRRTAPPACDRPRNRSGTAATACDAQRVHRAEVREAPVAPRVERHHGLAVDPHRLRDGCARTLSSGPSPRPPPPCERAPARAPSAPASSNAPRSAWVSSTALRTACSQHPLQGVSPRPSRRDSSMQQHQCARPTP